MRWSVTISSLTSVDKLEANKPVGHEVQDGGQPGLIRWRESPTDDIHVQLKKMASDLYIIGQAVHKFENLISVVIDRRQYYIEHFTY